MLCPIQLYALPYLLIYWAYPGLFYIYFCTFLIPIELQFHFNKLNCKKAKMTSLGIEPLGCGYVGADETTELLRQPNIYYSMTQKSLGFAKNGSIPASFIILFWSFQTNIITIFTTKICEKCSSSIQCRDLIPQPLEHESPPITNRQGLLPSFGKLAPMLLFAPLKLCYN